MRLPKTTNANESGLWHIHFIVFSSANTCYSRQHGDRTETAEVEDAAREHSVRGLRYTISVIVV